MILINHNNHNDQRSINTWIISGMHSLMYGEFNAFCLAYGILYFAGVPPFLFWFILTSSYKAPSAGLFLFPKSEIWNRKSAIVNHFCLCGFQMISYVSLCYVKKQLKSYNRACLSNRCYLHSLNKSIIGFFSSNNQPVINSHSVIY